MLLDHIFICVDENAPEADELVFLGLAEGTPNRHRGQGTANRRFFLPGVMLELLWVADLNELQSATTRTLGLADRFAARKDGGSPFGFVFKPKNPRIGNSCPFPFRSYHPAYLPETLDMKVADATPRIEPLYVFIDFLPASCSPAQHHPCGIERLTSVHVTFPAQGAPSPVARMIDSLPGMSARVGREHLLELCFDDGKRGVRHDLRNRLPLIIRW